MELRKKYTEYFKIIQTIWMDQIDAGAMIGRATANEVIANYEKLKEKIASDDTLTMSEKVELGEMIQERLAKVDERESEILRAEQVYDNLDPKTCEKINNIREHVHEAEVTGPQTLYSNNPGLRDSKNLRRAISDNYFIFFNPETLLAIYNGNNSGLELEIERIKKEYPTIYSDIVGYIQEVIKKEQEKSEER